MRKKLQTKSSVRAQFKDWCVPKRGNANPERQTNDVWSWLVETRVGAYTAHEAAGAGERVYPGWCFARYGQSETVFADGTKIYIGGEHEDHYDPDFYIYNDVVAVRPDASIEIFGYPKDVFPPTDFHSATLVGDKVYIIGGLRYPENRSDHETQVYQLELEGFSIHRVEVNGQAPSWLYDHKAELNESGTKIVCTGGQVTHHQAQRTVENLTTWEFDLETLAWAAAGSEVATRWLLEREDESSNDLFGIESVVRASRSSRLSKFAERYKTKFAQRGHVVDAELFYSRFQPPIPHSPVAIDPDSDEFKVHRILIDGVIVRYVEDMHEIAVTVEGELSGDTIEVLKRHGLETYSRLEGLPYKCILL